MCFLGTAVYAQHAEAPAGPGADDSLKRLMAGNDRYVAQKMTHDDQSIARRMELTGSQHPFASVLSCSDSRVPPEVVFDQGLGDLFVVRVAGNVAPDEAVASLEYAVDHLGPKLILVLGHQSCGAVGATLDGGTPEGHLASLVNRLLPAVQKATGADRRAKLDSAVRINVLNVVEELRKSHPILDKQVADHTIRIVGGRYALDTGRVEILYP